MPSVLDEMKIVSILIYLHHSTNGEAKLGAFCCKVPEAPAMPGVGELD